LADLSVQHPEKGLLAAFDHELTASFVQLNQLNSAEFTELAQFVFDNFRRRLLSFLPRQQVSQAAG
jgi:hypothetical protein